jgi:predicted nucleic acid-binding Zn ribbon protein
MAKPIKFRARNPRFRIVNKCIMCGKIISMGQAICNSCNLKRKRALRGRR